MFCIKCGKQNDDQAIYCLYCGTKILIDKESEPVNPENISGDLIVSETAIITDEPTIVEKSESLKITEDTVSTNNIESESQVYHSSPILKAGGEVHEDDYEKKDSEHFQTNNGLEQFTKSFESSGSIPPNFKKVARNSLIFNLIVLIILLFVSLPIFLILTGIEIIGFLIYKHLQKKKTISANTAIEKLKESFHNKASTWYLSIETKYTEALKLESEEKYYKASLIFESIYTFRNAKPHMDSCLIKYYNQQLKEVVQKQDKNLLLSIFLDIQSRIQTGKDTSFFNAIHKEIKNDCDPILKSLILEDQKNYIKIPPFVSNNKGSWVSIPELLIKPASFSYVDLVCFCVIKNQDEILNEWQAVQSFNRDVSENFTKLYLIKNQEDLGCSDYFYNNREKIEKWLGLKFLNPILAKILNKRLPKTDNNIIEKGYLGFTETNKYYNSQMKVDNPAKNYFSEYHLRKIVDERFGDFQ